jgi:anti-sigma-K factor RskA
MSMTCAFSAVAGLWDKVAFWRSLAAVLAVAMLALLVAALIGRAPPDFSVRPILAVIQDGGHHPLWAIRLAGNAHQIAVDSLHPPPVPPGRVYQLWLEPSPGAGMPRPLGLLPQSGRKEIPETPANTRMLSGPGVLAVTLEPLGGSLGKGPTGPTLFRSTLADQRRAGPRAEAY